MIEQIIIISLFCCGLFVTGEPDMIFHSVKEWIRAKATYVTHETRVVSGDSGSTEYFQYPTIQKERWWFAPLWGCVLCMASIWGTIGFILLNYQWFDLDLLDLILTRWFITVFAVCITNGIIWNVYGLVGNLLQYWEERTK